MKIQELQKEYDLKKDVDFWHHQQSGQWIIKHSAVEKIAAKEGIKLVDLESMNSEVDLVRFKVIMSLPNGGTIKSIGEADRNNCFSQYLGCMAEKRGVDRCVLKSINAYQYGISSEVEAEEFRKPDFIENEQEATGITHQDTPKTPKTHLVCPKCGKDVLDKRVEDIEGNKVCPKSHNGNGKNLPAFRCADNDDVKNPTCSFASWKTDEVEAGVLPNEIAPHHRQADLESDQDPALPF